MKTVLFPDDPDILSLPIGGKARALARLTAAGFPVPAWAVVLPGEPAPGDEARWKDAARTLGGDRWAVRSSAIDEDGAEHSFAGQLDSFLNVGLDDLPARIEDVRRSGAGERVLAYRREAGLSLPPPVPAVILQKMIQAETAGVAFSSDPVTGRRGVAVVAAVPGLGDSLVSGVSDSDTFRVDRFGRVIEVVPAPERRDSGCCLQTSQVLDVATLARRSASHFGCPQDIEWAVEGNLLFLLQSRPITSLRQLPDPDGVYDLWDNSNIAESYNGVTTPLTFSFARHVYEEVYRQFVRILRVPATRIAQNRQVFARMLGLIRGRIYYNLPNWYRVLAMLPGYSLNRKFMEQMMGVREGLPAELDRELKPTAAGWRDWVEVVVTLGGLIRSHWRLEQSKAEFEARLNRSLAPGPVPLESMRLDELTAAFRSLQLQLLTRWDAPLINDFFAMIYYGLLRSLAVQWCADKDGTLQNDLISGQGGIISAEPARRMTAMAKMTASDPHLVRILGEAPLPAIQAAVATKPDLRTAVDSYLEAFGDRCLEELKLESNTLHDDPLMLFRSLGRMAANPSMLQTRAPAHESIARSGEERAMAALARHPIRRLVFKFILSRARDRVRDRENLRFERTRVFGRVRRIFLEIGRRLHAEGFLVQPRDIFMLTVEEILGFVEGTAVTTRLADLVELRKREFADFSVNPPSDRFETRGAVPVGNRFQATSSAPASAGHDSNTRKGTGCCPGVVRGPARVILDPRNAHLEPGEILVAPRTDPGWIMLFPAAAGLLVEFGSLLSHSAIVAREMGIPAVVSVPGLTTWLQTGDWVELDGASGTVRRLVGPGEARP